MKNQFLLILIIYISINSFAQNKINTDTNRHHCWVDENSWTFGAGSAFEVEELIFGVHTRLYYNVKKHLCFGPEYNFFYKPNGSINELNFVAHYIFDIHHLGFYPVGGGSAIFHHGEQSYGAIIGAGLHRNFKHITLFTEYVHGFYYGLGTNNIQLGLMYMFKI